MISFDDFIPNDQSPIYLQIILHVKRGIAAGNVVDGDEVPSRRSLSALLGVNPNTVQKSYHILEEEGIIVSSPGAKSCVTIDQQKITLIRTQLMGDQAKEMIHAMKQMRISKEEALATLSSLWEDIPS
ncbi:MAG: GntR family transcriptional regulator [Clostridia bacterium]|nr:GntR family transcriptional regulator [Clostridia bacterium]MBQ5814069.1 GntR family transcriptional regulator [Clostridia bacterium]